MYIFIYIKIFRSALNICSIASAAPALSRASASTLKFAKAPHADALCRV